MRKEGIALLAEEMSSHSKAGGSVWLEACVRAIPGVCAGECAQLRQQHAAEQLRSVHHLGALVRDGHSQGASITADAVAEMVQRSCVHDSVGVRPS